MPALNEAEADDEATAMLRLTCRLRRAIWEGRNKLFRVMAEEEHDKDPLEMEGMLSDSLWQAATTCVVDFAFEASRGDSSYMSLRFCFSPLGERCQHFAPMCERLFSRQKLSKIVDYYTQSV